MVPRCLQCQGIHRQDAIVRILGAALAFVLWVFIIVAIDDHFRKSDAAAYNLSYPWLHRKRPEDMKARGWIWLVWLLGFAAVTRLSALAVSRLFLRLFHSDVNERDFASEHPSVTAHRRDGWRIGNPALTGWTSWVNLLRMMCGIEKRGS